MIAMPAAPAIYGTGIETGGTADTFQGAPEIFPAQMYAPAVVHQYNMHFLPECPGVHERSPRSLPSFYGYRVRRYGWAALRPIVPHARRDRYPLPQCPVL